MYLFNSQGGKNILFQGKCSLFTTTEYSFTYKIIMSSSLSTPNYSYSTPIYLLNAIFPLEYTFNNSLYLSNISLINNEMHIF